MLRSGQLERALGMLLIQSHTAAQYQLPDLISDAAAELGVRDATAYLVDLQQTHLFPFVSTPTSEIAAVPLPVESTLAGRAYQHGDVLNQAGDSPATARVWVPLLNGTERLGVLALTVAAEDAADLTAGAGREPAERFSALVAEVVMTKTLYGDEIVRLRRRAQMGLAAELQWSLLPPLTFACREVSIAGALEPAYRVAGDTLDYAVDAGIARAAVLDGMGHSLRSGQLAAIAVAGYRNARRSGLGLLECARAIDEALLEAFGGGVFTTGLLAELDTHTGQLSWINAGHPAPLLLREHHLVKTLACQPRAPLGLQLPPDAPARDFVICREQLEPGDRVVLFTDGVTEARSPEGEFFGERRLTDLLQRNFAARLPSAETMRRVVRALLQHQQGQLTDDASLLMIEWRSGSGDVAAHGPR